VRKETTMIAKSAIALGVAGALIVSGSATAGLLPTGTAAIKDVVPLQTTEVHWRGGGVAAAVGLGLLGAAILAPRAYGYGGYGYGGYYGYGPAYYPAYYGPAYGSAYYGPAYYGPAYYGPRRVVRYRHWRRW
jgi:hypothetical protein